MLNLSETILEQIAQAIAEAVWKRPEFSKIREPIEQALTASSFQRLTGEVFAKAFDEQARRDLPHLFDAGFIAMPAVQQHLARHIVDGSPVDVERLSGLYAQRHLVSSAASDIRPQLERFLSTLRTTFAAHPIYGPILLARDLQTLQAGLNGLRGEMHERFDVVEQKIDDLVTEYAALSHSSSSSALDQIGQRQLEIEYLNTILLKYEDWKKIYTPMAGVARFPLQTLNKKS